MAVPMYAGTCSGMYACTWRERDVGIYRHRVSCYIHTYRTTAKRSAKRSQDGPPYLPAATAARGPDLSALRPRPAPIVAAALDRRRQCALRDGPARRSRLPRTADERTSAKRSQVRRSTQSGTLRTGQGYCEYSHLQYAAVRSCHSPPRPSAALVPAHLQFASARP